MKSKKEIFDNFLSINKNIINKCQKDELNKYKKKK